jgi:hypothetical protein
LAVGNDHIDAFNRWLVSILFAVVIDILKHSSLDLAHDLVSINVGSSSARRNVNSRWIDSSGLFVTKRQSALDNIRASWSNW